MDVRFKHHNLHLESPATFNKLDPHLRELQNQSLAYRYPLLGHLPVDRPGIYSITGGRQIGKTTILKQWMSELLRAGVEPQRIAYFTGELIDDHHVLVRLLTDLLSQKQGPFYVLLDEVSYIHGWDRGIKYLADAGVLQEVILVLTGSDSVIICEARMRLPGRRGRADLVDFHLFPLSFYEYLKLSESLSPDILEEARQRSAAPDVLTSLLKSFETYLLHGGYLKAINDLETHSRITQSTLATYSDWIRGDVLKRGKQERFLREILEALIKRYGTQITWNSLAQDLTIDHPATVADYVDLLAGMDVLIVQPALKEDRLSGAPKKARKIVFSDPFIFHALRSWLSPYKDPPFKQVQALVSDPDWGGRLAEACAVSHYHRLFPTYYIKGEGEVDIAYIMKGRFWPIEVKWTGQIRTKDLKQVAKYRNSRICSKNLAAEKIHGILHEPLPLNLLRLGPSPHVFRSQ